MNYKQTAKSGIGYGEVHTTNEWYPIIRDKQTGCRCKRPVGEDEGKILGGASKGQNCKGRYCSRRKRCSEC